MEANAKKKILLVDDSALIRQIYTDKLKEEGYEVETASDGEEGIFKMITFSPDIVVLDMFMPKLTGFEFIEKVKKEPSLAQIPIIAFSDVQVDSEDLIKKGVKHVLVKSEHKPVDVKEIIDKIIS
jgi:CheY-like chemotaxis protein